MAPRSAAASRHRLERRALQATVAAASMIPILTGAAGVLIGPTFVGGPLDNPDLASHFAYLSGIFIGLGFLFLATVQGIERKGSAFRAAASLVVCGGIARLLAFGLAGIPTTPHRLGLVVELVVVPLIVLWQARVARRCAGEA
ncbi:MAG: DUF4345 domain-containing protein [Geminicoccaceae bacterium]|nr:DUF4345 domain-containing protein [Geminicoccaceae bacterium]